MENKLEMGRYNQETQKLYREILKIYEELDLDKEKVLLEENYKSINSKDKISLAFIGQYSAGKSTIIKALTGEENIKIDSDIATSEVTDYKWGNFILTDTPGLNTNENKEHDELTRNAIKSADLLIYCITSDLFREVTKNDFKDLAKYYKNKMFLVINKMSKETGEYDVLVKNYKDSINRTLEPECSLIDFHHFFFDAADYVEGIKDDDDDFIEDSHFEEFIKALDEFIKIKGLTGRMLTPITVLERSIENSLIELEEDEVLKERKRLIQKICKVIDNKKASCRNECNRSVQETINKYIQQGTEIAINLGNSSYKFDDGDFQKFSNPLQEKLAQDIEEKFELYAEEVDEEVQEIMESEQAIYYFKKEEKRLQKEIEGEKGNELISTIEKGIGKATNEAAPKITSALAKLSNVEAGKEATIWAVNGSTLHKAVKNIGGKLGYKFKPFQALKISKNIAGMGRYLNTALVGAGIAMDAIGVLTEKKAEKDLREAKDSVKLQFLNMAKETEKHYNNEINEAAREFDKIKDELLKELNETEKQTQKKGEGKKKLEEYQEKIKRLREKIEYGSNN